MMFDLETCMHTSDVVIHVRPVSFPYVGPIRPRYPLIAAAPCNVISRTIGAVDWGRRRGAANGDVVTSSSTGDKRHRRQRQANVYGTSDTTYWLVFSAVFRDFAAPPQNFCFGPSR